MLAEYRLQYCRAQPYWGQFRIVDRRCGRHALQVSKVRLLEAHRNSADIGHGQEALRAVSEGLRSLPGGPIANYDHYGVAASPAFARNQHLLGDKLHHSARGQSLVGGAIWNAVYFGDDGCLVRAEGKVEHQRRRGCESDKRNPGI